MKNLYLSTALLILAACGGESNTEEANDIAEELTDLVEDVAENLEDVPEEVPVLLIEGNAAGEFKLGNDISTESELFEIMEDAIIMQGEGETWEETVYKVEYNGEFAAELYPYYNYEDDTYDNTIGEMKLYSGMFQTPEGIGVGSTIEDFVAVYEDHDVWYTYVSGMYVIETPGINAQFLLDENGFDGEPEITGDMTVLEVSDFAVDTKIIKIRMFEF